MTKKAIMSWNWRLETRRRKTEQSLESKGWCFLKKELFVNFPLPLPKTTRRWGIRLEIGLIE